MQSLEFIIDRFEKSKNAAACLAPGWVWEEMDGATMGSTLAAINVKVGFVVTAETNMKAARLQLDQALDLYARHTRDALRLAKIRWRNEPVNRGLLAPLKSRGQSRQTVLDEGLAAEKVWKKIDALWKPLPDLTFALFEAEGVTCAQLKSTYGTKQTAWREAAGQLQEMAGKMDENNVAWYANATTAFPAGTAKGDLIRETVPTTTQPEPEIAKAQFDETMQAAGGIIHLDFHADHATEFKLLHKPPAAPDYVVVASDLKITSFTLENQNPGEHKFRVVGRNAHGEGPASDEVTVVVPVLAA